MQPVQPQPQVNQQHPTQQHPAQQLTAQQSQVVAQGGDGAGGRGGPAGTQGEQQGRNIQTPVMISDETIRSTMTLPANPYTSEAFQTPTRDSHYYLTSNVSNFTRVGTHCFIKNSQFVLIFWDIMYFKAWYEVRITDPTKDLQVVWIRKTKVTSYAKFSVKRKELIEKK